LSAAALERHFAAQIESRGWAQLAGNSDDIIAWSLWRLPEPDEWQGTLIVTQAPDASRAVVWIRVESATRLFPTRANATDAPLLTEPASDRAADPALTRELAERLIMGPSGRTAGPASNPAFLVGRLSPDLPADLPMPESARVLGSLIRLSPDDRLSSSETILDMEGSPRFAQQLFIDALTGAGWEISPWASLGGPTGFVSRSRALSASFCRAGSFLNLTFGGSPSAHERSDVRITSDKPEGDGCWETAAGPIQMTQVEPSSPARSWPSFGLALAYDPFFPPPEVAIPPLTGPPGAPLEDGTIVGDTQYDSAIVTSRPVSEVEAFFGQQLQDVGWVRRAGTASRPFAWSLWTVPGKEDWQVLLLVFDVPGENHHALSLKVRRVDSDPLQMSRGLAPWIVAAGGFFPLGLGLRSWRRHHDPGSHVRMALL
jgi:hypothetical protein